MAGNPYADLEDEDEAPSPPRGNSSVHSSVYSFARSTVSTATSRFKHARPRDSDDEDERSAATIREKNLRMNTTRFSDTQVPVDNRSMASVSNPYASSRAPTTSSARFGDKLHRGKVAPAFRAQAPMENANHKFNGYQYQANRPDQPRMGSTWNTIDPVTGVVHGGGTEVHKLKHSDNPHHPMNDPLAATFGTTDVREADGDDNTTTHLTADNLEEHGLFVPQLPAANRVNDFFGTTYSNAGSPADFDRAPPSVGGYSISNADSSDRPSEKSSIYMSGDGSVVSTDTYRPTINTNPHIHADVRANFVTDIDALHDMHGPMTEFQRLNSDWLSPNPSTLQAITMKIGEGNVMQLKVKSEERTRKMDMFGNYKDGSKSHGEVAKRFRRGFMEMVKRLEDEMLKASAEYRKWRMMSPDERVELLREIRRPTVQFNGSWVPVDGDSMEAPLPKIYRRMARDHRRKVQRMRDLLERRSSVSVRSKSVTSTGTTDTRPAIGGTLGDCDSQYFFAEHIHGNNTNDDLESNSRLLSSAQSSLKRLSLFEAREYRGRESSRRIQSERRQRNASQLSASLLSAAGSSSSRSTVRQQTRNIHSSAQGSSNAVSRPLQTPSKNSSASLMPPPSNSRASSYHPNTENTIRNIRTSGHGDVTSSTTGRSVTDGINNFQDLLEFDDSPELQMPSDISGPGSETLELDANMERFLDIAIKDSSGRGRVVVVRLHQLVEFTPGAIARRVFGGNVQEFQLHPDRRTAVVVFLHANEARSFVHHYLNVREKGTAQEIRDLQIEVSWYRGKEAESCLPPQINLMKCHMGLEATRAIRICHIPIQKTLKQVRNELGEALQRMIVSVQLSKPEMAHLYEIEGQTCIVEFSTLIDAIEAYDVFHKEQVYGFENNKVEFVPELTTKPQPEKTYCGCLCCKDSREIREERDRKRMEKLRSDYSKASSAASSNQRQGTRSVSSVSGHSTPRASVANSQQSRGANRDQMEIDYSDDDDDDDEEEWAIPGAN